MLCDCIVLKIQSLFDIDCDECSETYRNELADKPLFTCHGCLQGPHQCEGMKSKADALGQLASQDLLPPGCVWLYHDGKQKTTGLLNH